MVDGLVKELSEGWWTVFGGYSISGIPAGGLVVGSRWVGSNMLGGSVVGGSVDDLSVGRWSVCRWSVCRWFCNTPWFTILHMLIEILLPTTYLLLMNTSSGKSCKFSISSISISSSSSSTITIFFAKGCLFHWKHGFLSKQNQKNTEN